MRQFHEIRERLLRAGIAPRHVRRYINELRVHLRDLIAEEDRAGHDHWQAEASALVRLGTTDDLTRAMAERPEFKSFSARAPWLAFGVMPLCLLAAAYFVACLILWSGWKIFLPAAISPFTVVPGPVYGLENIYFQTGRMIYFGAPLVVGWAISITAARHRLRALWPSLGLILTALIGSTAAVRVQRPSLSMAGQVTMTLAVSPSVRGIFEVALRALVLFSIALLPYFVWRIAEKKSHEISS